MTDDKIDADLRPVLAKYWEYEDDEITVLQSERIAYRAGMRRAAKIARRVAGEFFAVSNVERSIGADIAAAAIERAAGGEG